MKHTQAAFIAVLTVAGAAVTFAAAYAATNGVQWQPKTVTLPSPGGFYSGPNATLLNSNCVTCHTAGFVERQPAMSLAGWTVEVTKMKNAFGAPLQADDIPKIAQALVDMQAGK